MTAWARGPLQFSIFRFLLGLGEAGNFPGGLKVVTEWFSPQDRAFAGGIFSSGGSLGILVAAPLVGMLIHSYGWRSAFVLTGILGFLWVVAWLCIYPAHVEPGSVTDADGRSLVGNDQRSAQSDLRWIQLWRFRQVWALTLGRLLEEPILWFCVFWLPTYLIQVRGISLLRTGWLLTLPYIGLDIGYIAGGWISKRLVQRGATLRDAKRITMSIAALLMVNAALAVYTANLVGFVALISLAALGHGAWFSNVMTMPADFTSHRHVASVYGITSVGGGIGGIIATQLTGTLAYHFHTFKPVFIGIGLMPLAGNLLLFLLLGKPGVFGEICIG
jgi:ACS family hexuronate transporter-like MFS transporter